jgi:aminodeoxyfutalosine synthase
MNATLYDPAHGVSSLLPRALRREGLEQVADKVLAGVRLDLDDGARLFAARDASLVGALANIVRERLHGDRTWFNRNQHVNATNVCEATCMFCSFSRLKTGDPQAYTMSIEQALQRVRALRGELVTEVHIVNGLNPDLPFSYYTDLLRALKEERPDIHIKGFTAVEIHYYAHKYGMDYAGVLTALREAGLDSLPGGGAEIFHPRVRRKICDDKVDADGWLEVHRTAHRLGMRSNCTMLFGMIETPAERLDHMSRLRDLQDETGGFQTFIPLKFHNEHNRLSGLYEATGLEVLRTYAVARLFLDNIPHLKAYWPMLGVQVAQASLAWGVDDLDGTVREERIYHMAGATTPQALSRADLVALIREAGRVPVERDTLYHTAAEA